MTATPIPRTSALTVFGDLDVTVLDELPPGRTPIETTWLPGEPALDVLTGDPWSLVRDQVAAGRQAYVVASLVEDNENLAAKSAEDALTSLDAGALNGLRLGLVHGKQKREEREATMDEFKNGNLDVLVSTTVIEVGVNVPNATVMVILDATRFGLAQLHQLRGRVGRGAHKSWCVLTGKAGSADAVKRMQALEESTDGFYLSEVDLSLRGTGSLFGARQSGQSDLRVADLERDLDLIVECRTEADLLLDGDPKLGRRPGLRMEIEGALGAEAREWLTKT
jgi:ATP-dependent DNA helicase RecG